MEYEQAQPPPPGSAALTIMSISAVTLATHDMSRDAERGERYFHLLDPDGHELSFAKPLEN